jgi:nicotinamidase-related amidase
MKFTIDPSRTALVITSPQIDFLSPSGAAWDLFGAQATERGIVGKLRTLRDAASKANLPVFYSMMGFTAAEQKSWRHRNGLQSTMFERKMCDWERGGRVVPELEPTPGTVVLSPRRGLSAFHSTDIDVQLRQRNVQVIVLAGLAANLCIESHLRDGIERGYDVVVVEDAVSTLSEPALQAALGVYALLATRVVSTPDFVAAL